MTFKEFLVKILESYISENADYAAIYSDQINGIVSFNSEINGYGAYSHFTLKPDCLRFSGTAARGYGANGYFIIMEGREYELGFILAITDGMIDFLEIYPNDGEGWDGVVRPFICQSRHCLTIHSSRSSFAARLNSGVRPHGEFTCPH